MMMFHNRVWKNPHSNSQQQKTSWVPKQTNAQLLQEHEKFFYQSIKQKEALVKQHIQVMNQSLVRVEQPQDLFFILGKMSTSIKLIIENILDNQFIDQLYELSQRIIAVHDQHQFNIPYAYLCQLRILELKVTRHPDNKLYFEIEQKYQTAKQKFPDSDKPQVYFNYYLEHVRPKNVDTTNFMMVGEVVIDFNNGVNSNVVSLPPMPSAPTEAQLLIRNSAAFVNPKHPGHGRGVPTLQELEQNKLRK